MHDRQHEGNSGLAHTLHVSHWLSTWVSNVERKGGVPSPTLELPLPVEDMVILAVDDALMLVDNP